MAKCVHAHTYTLSTATYLSSSSLLSCTSLAESVRSIRLAYARSKSLLVALQVLLSESKHCRDSKYSYCFRKTINLYKSLTDLKKLTIVCLQNLSSIIITTENGNFYTGLINKYQIYRDRHTHLFSQSIQNFIL